MRPTKHPQSALAHPLNLILGTEAHVRVLRAVLLADVPIGLADIARATALQRSGIAAVCDRLVELGVIERIGSARSRRFRKATRGDLPNVLTALFTAERNRAKAIFVDVRSAVQSASATIRAAWIEGPAANGTDRTGDPIVIGAVADADDEETSRQTLSTALLRVQQDREVSIELRMLTVTDLRAAEPAYIEQLESARSLLGEPPTELARTWPTTRAAAARVHERPGSTGPGSAPNPGPLRGELARFRPDLIATAAAHGARDLRLFGSAARGADGPESDVDLLVSLDQGRSLADLVRLEQQLEQLLGRRVDVVTEASLQEPIRAAALREALRV